MQIEDRQPTGKGPEAWFTGDVYIDVIAAPKPAPSRMRVNAVHFCPGARTAWHSHAIGQTLYVTEGVGRVQARDGEIMEIQPGQTIYIQPGEWHWHGAAPNSFMTHLAMWEATEGGEPETTWGDQVTEAEYRGA